MGLGRYFDSYIHTEDLPDSLHRCSKGIANVIWFRHASDKFGLTSFGSQVILSTLRQLLLDRQIRDIICGASKKERGPHMGTYSRGTITAAVSGSFHRHMSPI